MATMTISLPEPMKRWIEAQAASGRVESADQLLHDLIRREQERTDKIAAMQRLVDEARESGTSDRTVDKVFAGARERAVAAGFGA